MQIMKVEYFWRHQSIAPIDTSWELVVWFIEQWKWYDITHQLYAHVYEWMKVNLGSVEYGVAVKHGTSMKPGFEQGVGGVGV